MEIEHAIKELQETVIVMAHIQAQHAVMAKDHAQWLADHSKAIAEMRELQRASGERMAAGALPDAGLDHCQHDLCSLLLRPAGALRRRQ